MIFSTPFVLNISHSKKNSAHCHKFANVFMQSVRHSCQIEMKLYFLDRFSKKKILKYQISWKSVQWEPSCSMRTDTWRSPWSLFAILRTRLKTRRRILVNIVARISESWTNYCVHGHRITGVTGSVLLNGRERNLDAFRRMSCYITQDDRLQPLLTVCENMHIAADLKLGERMSKKEKTNIVSTINLLLYVNR